VLCGTQQSPEHDAGPGDGRWAMLPFLISVSCFRSEDISDETARIRMKIKALLEEIVRVEFRNVNLHKTRSATTRLTLHESRYVGNLL
jgi:hypothetical protein